MNLHKRDLTKQEFQTLSYLTFFDGLLRAIWWERLDPTRDRKGFLIRFDRAWDLSFSSFARNSLGTSTVSRFDSRYCIILRPIEFERQLTPEWFDLLHSYVSFDKLLHDFHIDYGDPCREEWGQTLICAFIVDIFCGTLYVS
jgi:hypothetical protein